MNHEQTLFCYQCGAARVSVWSDSGPRAMVIERAGGCKCAVGWHAGRPDPAYVARLPDGWDVHEWMSGSPCSGGG